MLPDGVTGVEEVGEACTPLPVIADDNGYETTGRGGNGALRTTGSDGEDGVIPPEAGVIYVGASVESMRLPDWPDFSVIDTLSALARLLTSALALA